jgi:hypothetical protein
LTGWFLNSKTLEQYTGKMGGQQHPFDEIADAVASLCEEISSISLHQITAPNCL